jgi:hypothetical protein
MFMRILPQKTIKMVFRGYFIINNPKQFIAYIRADLNSESLLLEVPVALEIPVKDDHKSAVIILFR